MEWQPIETAPKDGTTIDLWMVDEGGQSFREAGAYWVVGARERQVRYRPDGTLVELYIKRDGWFAPNHDYDGDDGFADIPRWFNEHPNQMRWVGRSPTHWMPLPEPPK